MNDFKKVGEAHPTYADLTIGDAINWEWIVHCAKESGKNIIIASRDTDYGMKYSSELILNDWLLQEFRERVSNKRKILLTDKLVQAFRMASVSVTKKEEEQEQKLIEELSQTTKVYDKQSIKDREAEAWTIYLENILKNLPSET